MTTTAVKAILLAASLLFSASSFAQTKSKDAAAYANSGIAKLKKTDWGGAIADFNRALQLDPRLAIAYDARGLAKKHKGDVDGAIAEFNQALQLNPKLATAYYNRGNAKAQKVEIDAAIVDYNRVLQFDPRLAIGYDARGLAKERKGDFDEAIADCNRALQLNPKLATAYYYRGLAKMEKYELIVYGAVGLYQPDYQLGTLPKARKGDLDVVIGDFNRALQLSPKNADAYNDRGSAKVDKGDMQGGIADYNRALAVDPKHANTYLNRGNAEVVTGDMDSAIADYDRAINLHPKFEAEAYVGRGIAKAGKGDTNGAIADINQALRLDPKLAEAYASRGVANFLARNWSGALQDYRRFCELSQRSQWYPRLAIWLIRSRLSEKEAADKELAAHFNAAPGTWVSKVEAYLLGKLSESEFLAAAASRDANTDRGQHCQAWFYAGMKNLLNGNRPTAAEFFKKCLATKQKSEGEYYFAEAELKALGQ